MRLCKPARRESKGAEYASNNETRDAAQIGHVCFVVNFAGARSIRILFHDRFSGSRSQPTN